MARLRDCKIKVRNILRDHPEARNNDGTLIAHFINIHFSRFVQKDLDGAPAIKLANFRHLPPLETVRRCRQIIQNTNGEYLPTIPAVLKERRIKEKNMRDAEVREARTA